MTLGIEFYKITAAFSILFLFSTGTFVSYAQTTQTDFGQNRVQYHDFEWQYYESDHFDTYFYLGGQEIGKFVIQYAEKILPDIEQSLEYKLDDRIAILVYTDISDYNMTNIGIGLDIENIGGVTKIIDNKMFIYFNGDHNNLERQIREGIARIFVNRMMFGGNLQEVLQNAVLLNLPQWFTEGLIAYMAEPWSTEMDNTLKNGILSGEYKKFSKLTDEQARFAGHSLWHYIAAKYGRSSVPNLLYLTRINRSLESGFLFVMGKTVNGIIDEWYQFYSDVYAGEIQDRSMPPDDSHINKKIRKKRHYYETKLSPDGKHIAYATDQIGRIKAFVVNNETGAAKRLLKTGHKTVTLKTDYSYPLMAWTPRGDKLAVVYEKRDRHYLMMYDVQKGEKEVTPITKFQKVLSINFMNDPRMLVMSAMQKGQTDIFTYYIPSTKTEQITDDFYDDLDPAYIQVNGKEGFVFRSNRQSDTLQTAKLDTILPTGKMDLFFYNYGTRSNVLTRITNTPVTDETAPVAYDDDHFMFLSDESGINNRYAAYFQNIFSHYDTLVHYYDNYLEEWNYLKTDETLTLDSVMNNTTTFLVDSVFLQPVYTDVAEYFPITNYAYNIREHSLDKRAGKVLDLMEHDNQQHIYLYPLPDTVSANRASNVDDTYYREYLESTALAELQKAKIKVGEKREPEEKNTNDTLPAGKKYFFQSEFHYAPDYSSEVTATAESDDQYKYLSRLSKVLPYQVKFSTDYVVTQIDNRLIMTQYEKYTGLPPTSFTPELSGFIQLGIADLMEDYKISGGVRFPFDLKDIEYYLTYENLRKRIDKKILYYRKTDSRVFSNNIPILDNMPLPADVPQVDADVRTNYIQYTMKYPFDVLRSVRGHIAYRNERFIFQAKDRFSLDLPTYNENWLFAKLEYVYDNTINIALNLRNGLRYKFYWEVHKQFLIEKDTLFNNLKVDLPKFNNAYLSVAGVDFRHYQKVHKQIVWANRFAASFSFGTRRLLYYLGGVDSWIRPRFDSLSVDETVPYAFQTLATNLRGHKQNVRNGSSFALINSELRVPIFAYLINSPIRSDFIRNFQIVGFADVGTAWVGINPYDDENPLNTEEIKTPAVEVEINYFRNPLVAGYGTGIRTLILGYFIRVDVAWGLDSGESSPPLWYFSLTTDF